MIPAVFSHVWKARFAGATRDKRNAAQGLNPYAALFV
jgi:hypothetical protein